MSLQLLNLSTLTADKPNKKYYDVSTETSVIEVFSVLNIPFLTLCSLSLLQPRECLRAAELNTVARLEQCFEDLNCQGICGLGEKKSPTNILGPRRGGLPV